MTEEKHELKTETEGVDSNWRFKVFRLRMPIKAIIVIVLLIAVISAAGFKVSRSRTHELALFYFPGENRCEAVCDGKLSESAMEGGGVSAVRWGKEKGSCAVLMSNGGKYTLYFSGKGGSSVKVSENAGSRFAVSYNGRAVVYSGGNGVLYRYDTKKKSGEEISQEADSFAVSPDGETVIYSKARESARSLYIYSQGKSRYIADNFTPVGVSDDGEYIYAVSGSDMSLCLLNLDGTMKSKLCTGVNTSGICFSEDMTVAVFNDGEYTYISQEGKSKVRIIPDEAKLFSENDGVLTDSSGTGAVYPEESLTGQFYYSENKDGTKVIFYIDESFNRTDITEGAKTAQKVKEGLVYLTPGGEVKLFKNGESVTAGSSAVSAAGDSSGKYIYYITGEGELRVWKNGETQTIASGTEKIYITEKNVLLYVLGSGEMYAVKKQGQGEKIDDNVYGCIIQGKYAYYMKNYNSSKGVFELYGSEGDSDFTFIAKDVTCII